MTTLKPLRWNLNNAVQFEFKLEMQKTFHTIPIRFCDRFLKTVKLTYHVEIEGFLNVYLIFSGNEFDACAPSNLSLLFVNFIVFWE